MPYMPGTGYLPGFKFKTYQAASQPKISTLVATTLPAYKEAGELGPGISPMFIPAQPLQVLKGAGPLGVAGAIARSLVPTIPSIFRAGVGLFGKLPGAGKLLGPVLGPKAKAIPFSEIGGTVTKAIGTGLAVKEVAEFVSAPVLDIAQTVVSLGTQISELGPLGGNGMAHPSAGTSIAIRPSGPTGMGIMPGGDQIVKSWHANGIPFWRTLDGWIYVQRKDGTVKRYRPYKSVVLGKRPSSKQINRAINKLKREDKTYHKLTRLFHKPTRSKSAH